MENVTGLDRALRVLGELKSWESRYKVISTRLLVLNDQTLH